MRRLTLAALAASLWLAAPASAQNYHIGALLPNSGPMTQFGQLFSNGANLAADHINADKMLTKPFVINHEDSQGQPQAAVTGMNKLVRVNQEPMVLTAQSAVSKAIAPIGEREHVVTINGGGVAPDLAKLGPYFFNVIPLVNYEVRALVPYLAKEKKFKRIAIVYVEDPLGEACLNEIKENAPKNGMELVGAFSIPTTARQFAPIAAKVREVKPDVVFVAYFGQTMVQLVKQLRDAGVDTPFTSYSGFDDPDLKALPAAEGSIYSSQKMDWASTDPITARFVTDFKKKYGKDPTFYNANYYNAVWVTAKAMASLEKKGQPVTGETLRNEILSLKTFDAVGGKMEFQPDGTVSMPMQINELIKGGSKILK